MKLRPRFTLRTLAIIVTLVCAYFGAWEATKRWGVTDPNQDAPIAVGHAPVREEYAIMSPGPFLLRCDERELTPTGRSISVTWHRRYYLWMFGLKAKLPFETVPPPEADKPGGIF